MKFRFLQGILPESRLRESSHQVKIGNSDTKSIVRFFEGAKFLFKAESLSKFYVKMTSGFWSGSSKQEPNLRRCGNNRSVTVNVHLILVALEMILPLSPQIWYSVRRQSRTIHKIKFP